LKQLSQPGVAIRWAVLMRVSAVFLLPHPVKSRLLSVWLNKGRPRMKRMTRIVTDRIFVDPSVLISTDPCLIRLGGTG
jgi:hypothetical protein